DSVCDGRGGEIVDGVGVGPPEGGEVGGAIGDRDHVAGFEQGGSLGGFPGGHLVREAHQALAADRQEGGGDGRGGGRDVGQGGKGARVARDVGAGGRPREQIAVLARATRRGQRGHGEGVDRRRVPRGERPYVGKAELGETLQQPRRCHDR